MTSRLASAGAVEVGAPEPGSEIMPTCTMLTTTRALYALRTTSGRVVVNALAPDADPWLEAVRYVSKHLARDEYLADVAPATAQDVAAVQAGGDHVPAGRLAMT